MAGASRKLRVLCLDVGQGDCTFILPPDDKPPILFDCKDAHVARMFIRNRTSPITKLSAVIFSHLDDDHIAGGEQFIEDFLAGGGTIQYVYINADRDVSRRSNGSKTAKGLIDFVKERARERKFDLLTPTADPAEVDRSTAPRDWSVKIVGPRQEVILDVDRGETADEPNIYSVVLRAEFGGKAVVISGDAPLASWSQIKPDVIPSSAFRIPHHGGALDDGGTPAGWSAQRLYDEVNPSIGVISVGTRNQYGHPRADWVRPLLTRSNCSTICTQLTPRCESSLETDDGVLVHRNRNLRFAEEAEPAWRHRPDHRARGKDPPRSEVPCAGSIRIVLHEDGSLERFPEPGSDHAMLILPRVERAWCLKGPP